MNREGIKQQIKLAILISVWDLSYDPLWWADSEGRAAWYGSQIQDIFNANYIIYAPRMHLRAVKGRPILISKPQWLNRHEEPLLIDRVGVTEMYQDLLALASHEQAYQVRDLIGTWEKNQRECAVRQLHLHSNHIPDQKDLLRILERLVEF